MKYKDLQKALPAFQKLSALGKSPALALKLMRHGRKGAAELSLLEEMHNDILYECAGVEKPTPPDVLIVSIPPTIEVPGEDGAEPTTAPNPQNAAFWEKFNAVMDSECELAVLDITLDQLVEDLGKFPNNSISEDELELLEPFFKAPE